MTQAPIPCGTSVRHDGKTWTVRARALVTGEGRYRYWLADAEGNVTGPVTDVSRVPASESGALARALRRMGAR